ncbi:MAG TPA: hypothetical protein VFX49_14325, partial [Chloroflexota bacterium]|nr:hypothetical protein [Chloroflexota bacterium]
MTDTQTAAGTLPHITDQFRGVLVDAEQLPPDAEFVVALRRSLDAWTADGYRLVWLKLPLARAALVPIAVEHGFVYHHANEDDVMLTRKLVDDAFVPTHATHYVGVGGVVI